VKNEGQQPQGRLTIYLGYAPGVGKTYKMIEDGHKLAREGRDVVVGYFEPHGRQDTIARTEGLEFVPRRKLAYRQLEFEEMDTDAILARHPEICLVDELAHTNVPGSERGKRWEEVMILLDAGIDVLATMNVQHIESLNDEVRAITGIAVRETVPDWVVKRADEIVLVDLPPQALLNRLKRGAVYAPEKARQATEHFFKAHTLAALREMTIRQAAHEVDIRQGESGTSVSDSTEQSSPGSVPVGPVEAGDEKLLIHVSDDPSTAALIRRGRRVADYLRAECFAVCIFPSTDLEGLDPPAKEAIDKHLDFARRLHIETRVLAGEDPAQTLVDFARQNGVTQIFVSKPARRKIHFFASHDFAMKVVRLATDMQVSVVAERRH
jgi:two-component system, OmpR family, sensor histidine kinase KdpD